MKARWVALIAAATLLVGLATGLVAGFTIGLVAGGESAEARGPAEEFFPDGALELPDTVPPTAEPLPQLTLEVFSDGCGVIRSEAAPGVHYQTLTWVFRDADGFQVLGRAAESETRYRYFQPGQYSVVLEAYAGGSYQQVSNEVTVNC